MLPPHPHPPVYAVPSLERSVQTTTQSITPSRLPDVTTVPTHTCLCGSLPERSVQTTTQSIAPPRLSDVTTAPTPTCLCSSLPDRSVQTITQSITPPRLPDVTTAPTPNCLCGSLPERSIQTALGLCNFNTAMTQDHEIYAHGCKSTS